MLSNLVGTGNANLSVVCCIALRAYPFDSDASKWRRVDRTVEVVGVLVGNRRTLAQRQPAQHPAKRRQPGGQ